MMEKGLVVFLVLTGENGIGPFHRKHVVIKCTVGTLQKMEHLHHFFGVFCSCRVLLIVRLSPCLKTE